MTTNNAWPFSNGSTVCGMKLPEYLDWASGVSKKSARPKLVLPSIQRGFVWKPKQIIELWDSLLNGMPVGTVMVIGLSENETQVGLDDHKKIEATGKAWGLLDGQQRTLAMLMGFPGLSDNDHCLWIDLAEKGRPGWQFDIRLTTRTQPFGFNNEFGRLSRYQRKEARNIYNKHKNETEDKWDDNKQDYELFDDPDRPKPWKTTPTFFVKLRDLWQAYVDACGCAEKYHDLLDQHLRLPDNSTIRGNTEKLFSAFEELNAIEIPIIRISDKMVEKNSGDQEAESNPLIILFERIGRNGTFLSTEDLLFSMIKHQWQDAQRLVDEIIQRPEVGSFMSPLGYVMTAFRLAIAEQDKEGKARPNPKDIHRNLPDLLGSDKNPGPLRRFIRDTEQSELVKAFKLLHEALLYSDSNRNGFPMLLMPHLSRDLVHVLLRWIVLHGMNGIEEIDRNRLISFSLYWILHIRNESKSSEAAFKVLKKEEEEEKTSSSRFPSEYIYNILVGDQPEVGGQTEFHLALPLLKPENIKVHLLLDPDSSPDYSIFRSFHEIFKNDNKELSKFARESFILFCWNRKHLLLWLQRAYLAKIYPSTDMLAKFAGLTDEETVPYDYDHLCPQSHWGYAWGQVSVDGVPEEAELSFRTKRHEVGNCIGNLHVLDSSLNRSFGDKPFAEKADKEINNADGVTWDPNMDSLCNDVDCWMQASPVLSEQTATDASHRVWTKERLSAFQKAVYERAFSLYTKYYEGCKGIHD